MRTSRVYRISTFNTFLLMIKPLSVFLFFFSTVACLSELELVLELDLNV